MTVGTGLSLPSITTYFALTGRAEDTATESDASVPAPGDITVLAMSCGLDSAPGSSESRTFTLRAAGAGTVLTCTVSDTDKSCAFEPVTPLAVTAGDLLAWEATSSSSPVSAHATCVLSYSVDAF